MPDPDTISADYSLRPGELADTLALLVEARQPAIVWGPPGCAKSQIARQVAADAARNRTRGRRAPKISGQGASPPGPHPEVKK